MQFKKYLKIEDKYDLDIMSFSVADISHIN